MKKFLQITLIACAVMLVVLILPKTAFADGVTVMGGDPGMNGETYSYDICYFSPYISFTHVASNQTSSPDTVSFSVTREKRFDTSLTVQADIDYLVGKAGITAETTVGTTETVNTTCSWTISPYTVTTCRYGSAAVVSCGAIETWFYGTLTDSVPISVHYSYGSYSEKTEVPIG